MREPSNTCFFTGHRDISNVTYEQLTARLESLILRLYENGYRYFICGGALGFDTFAATYICSLKMRGFDVSLVLYLPCIDQTARWSDYDRRVYEHLMQRADEVVYVSREPYFSGCMQKRNRAMVSASSAGICFLADPRHSGTRQTVEYALSRGIPMVNVAPDGDLG